MDEGLTLYKEWEKNPNQLERTIAKHEKSKTYLGKVLEFEALF